MNDKNPALRPTREPALGPSDPGYYKQRVREGRAVQASAPVLWS